MVLYFEDEIKNVKFFMDNSYCMMYGGGWKLIVIGYLSDYG